MYYVKNSEPGLWTVGAGSGQDWDPVSDHGSLQEAEDKAAYMNGGGTRPQDDEVKELRDRVTALEVQIKMFLEGDRELASRVDIISDQVRKTAGLAVAIGRCLQKAADKNETHD